MFSETSVLTKVARYKVPEDIYNAGHLFTWSFLRLRSCLMIVKF
jgi:hypothetical protein